MRSKPLLFRSDGLADAVATALGDPSITLIEHGPAMGVLIADSCHEDSFSGKLFLDRVTWVRGDESVRAFRDFPCVCLYRAEQGAWVAEESTTGRLFPQASLVPYHVLFVPGADYEYLMGRKTVDDANAIFAYAQTRFGKLPGFHFKNGRLLAPEGYAAAKEGIPGARQYVSEAGPLPPRYSVQRALTSVLAAATRAFKRDFIF